MSFAFFAPRALRPVAVFAGLVLLSGCSANPPPSYQGYIEADYIHLSSPEPGRLERLLTAQGQIVASNTPLFTLESVLETAARCQVRQQLGAATALLDDLRTGKRPLELEVIRAQLAQAEAAQHRSAIKRERDEAQFKAGGIARAQLDDSLAAAEADAARVRELKTQLEVATLPAREDQIKAQTAHVAAAVAQLEQADWRLNQKTVAAIRSGRITETYYREGEWVPAGRPVVRLLPPDHIKIRFFVPEPVIGGLHCGQGVRFHIDGVPDELPATITYVAAEPEYTPPIIYSNETRAKLVFMIEARPEPGRAANLHPGQPVTVRVP